MKRIVAMAVVLFILCMSTASAYDQIEVEPTTEQEIKFLGMSWNITAEQFQEELQKQISGITFDVEEYPSKSKSMSYSDRQLIPLVASSTLKTVKLIAKNLAVSVAGLRVNEIRATFYGDDTYSLYEATFKFDIKSIKDMSSDEIYEDLRTKLTNLYGEPYELTGAGHSGSVSYKHCIWVGDNNTAAILDMYDAFNYKGIELSYGSIESYYIFSEHEEAEQKAKDKEHQDLLDSISQKTNGL